MPNKNTSDKTLDPCHTIHSGAQRGLRAPYRVGQNIFVKIWQWLRFGWAVVRLEQRGFFCNKILFSFSSDIDRRTDSRIRRKNTAQPRRESHPGPCEWELCKTSSCIVTSEAGELQGSCLTRCTAIDVQTMISRTLCSSWLTNISWIFFSKTKV